MQQQLLQTTVAHAEHTSLQNNARQMAKWEVLGLTGTQSPPARSFAAKQRACVEGLCGPLRDTFRGIRLLARENAFGGTFQHLALQQHIAHSVLHSVVLPIIALTMHSGSADIVALVARSAWNTACSARVRAEGLPACTARCVCLLALASSKRQRNNRPVLPVLCTPS